MPVLTLKELEEIAATTPAMTGEEWDKLRRSCPEWVAREEQREKERLERAAKFAEEAKPLTADLATAGWSVESEWDLVNSSERYPEAVPVLTKHLQRPYHYRIREGIIRALTVPEARGKPARVMLEEYRNSGNERDHVRWAMVNALNVIADASLVEDMQALLANERDEAVARVLKLTIVKAKKRKAVG